MLYMHVDVSSFQMACGISAASSIDSTVCSEFKPHLWGALFHQAHVSHYGPHDDLAGASMHSWACMQPAAAVPFLEAQKQRPRRSERMQCTRGQTLSGLWALSLRLRCAAEVREVPSHRADMWDHPETF